MLFILSFVTDSRYFYDCVYLCVTAHLTSHPYPYSYHLSLRVAFYPVCTIVILYCPVCVYYFPLLNKYSLCPCIHCPNLKVNHPLYITIVLYYWSHCPSSKQLLLLT